MNASSSLTSLPESGRPIVTALLLSWLALGCSSGDGQSTSRAQPPSKSDKKLTADSGAHSGIPDGHRAYELNFEGRIGERPFACGDMYDAVGLGPVELRPVDFRVWIHDIELVREDGSKHALELLEGRETRTIEDDGAWQRDGLALLDFEDATGSCTGTTEMRHYVVGSAPEHEDYVGLNFRVGVPDALNHVDATIAEYPLGAPGMSWQWKGGLRFFKMDVATDEHDKVYFHLGSTGCEGSIGSYDCSVKNIAAVALNDFDPDSDVVLVNGGAIYKGLDINLAARKSVACMSGGTDNPLCPSMFAALGLGYGNAQPPETQSVFTVKGAR